MTDPKAVAHQSFRLIENGDVELAEQIDGVYGARMTGGGFGGCTIALVQTARVEEFQTRVGEGYERSTGRKPEIYICSAADGVGRVA